MMSICGCGAVTPEAIKFVAVIYKLSLTVAVIYKLSLNVAVIYKPSLTCRHLHADHSGTPYEDAFLTIYFYF